MCNLKQINCLIRVINVFNLCLTKKKSDIDELLKFIKKYLHQNKKNLGVNGRIKEEGHKSGSQYCFSEAFDCAWMNHWEKCGSVKIPRSVCKYKPCEVLREKWIGSFNNTLYSLAIGIKSSRGQKKTNMAAVIAQ